MASESFPDIIVHFLSDAFSRIFVDPGQTQDNGDGTETEYVTQVRYLGPLHDQKYILVSSMPSYYTDEQLNSGYHRKEEYVNAINKYGYIYKYQKFENADTVEKLEEYAADWIKNNYYGGIKSFEVTALDLHMEDQELNQYMVGDQMDVTYYDPDAQEDVTETLTCISAEYDLYNPDKNKYKIGIPDTTLNKVYGESSKSGGGGGGGGNNESENDTDSDQEQESLIDRLTAMKDYLLEKGWSTLNEMIKDGDLSSIQTPDQEDPTGAFYAIVRGDYAKIGKMALGNLDVKSTVKAAKAAIQNLEAKVKLKASQSEFTEIIDAAKGVSFGGTVITPRAARKLLDLLPPD